MRQSLLILVPPAAVVALVAYAIFSVLTTPAGPAEVAFEDLPIAPESQRVDLAEPSFSNPTSITNPLFPISNLHSAILLGTVDGRPFRVETTLLPETKIIEWKGQKIETLVSQYTAYLGGRIHEVALDWYAQADDGSVWYFGEDVFNYEDGVIADTHGTWLAGRDGPAAMIMPGQPQVGNVYRPENIPDVVFEEVTVESIDKTVHGPRGAVHGSIVTKELHMDGSFEAKIFAPGYGEFLTGVGGDVEAIALAVPTDALTGMAPTTLETLWTGAVAIFDAAQTEDWNAALATIDAMIAAWNTHQAGDVPGKLEAQMSAALDVLVAAVDARQPAETGQAAIPVAHAAIDLKLQYLPPVQIDRARFNLWTRQALIDAAAEDSAAVKGDIATLEWIWGRIAHAFESSEVIQINTQLADFRAAAEAEDLAKVRDAAVRLGDAVRLTS